jgi:hypothetical protein
VAEALGLPVLTKHVRNGVIEKYVLRSNAGGII